MQYNLYFPMKPPSLCNAILVESWIAMSEKLDVSVK